jgi:hypothetical protein
VEVASVNFFELFACRASNDASPIRQESGDNARGIFSSDENASSPIDRDDVRAHIDRTSPEIGLPFL